jgi:energy-converting hydrogenase A subunit I
MDKLKTTSWILLILSLASILYAMIYNPATWIVYIISLVAIPVAILSFGLIVMAKGSKEEEENKRREPFIGY